MKRLCDVPGCAAEAREHPFGSLCRHHQEQAEAAFDDGTLFPVEQRDEGQRVGLMDVEVLQELYAQWLGRQQ